MQDWFFCVHGSGASLGLLEHGVLTWRAKGVMAATTPNLLLDMGEVRPNVENMFQFLLENGSKSLYFQSLGLLWSSWATSWRQDGPRCELGGVLCSIWTALGRYLGAKMAQISAKIAPSWHQDGPS
jgi:hypothetical protein